MPNRRYDDEIETDHGFEPRDREITLGATMILGIFFALVLVCAIFFGLGYQVGRKSLAGQSAVKDPSGANSGVIAEKPAAGSPLVGSPTRVGDGGPSVSVPVGPAADAALQPTPVATRVVETSGEVSGGGAGAAVAPPVSAPAAVVASRPAATPAYGPAPVSSAGWVVQVAAVSHQEDADLLSGELRRRGYNVGVHSDGGDKLLHVQIGPMGNHKDADAMRQRLLNDGFNAIVKEIH